MDFPTDLLLPTQKSKRSGCLGGASGCFAILWVFSVCWSLGTSGFIGSFLVCGAVGASGLIGSSLVCGAVGLSGLLGLNLWEVSGVLLGL